jgi:hypothetical protein
MAYMTRHYATTTEARREFRALLDGAHAGQVITVARETERYAVVDTERLLSKLMQVRPANAVVLAEGGGWAALLPEFGIHAEGDNFEEAVADLILALREYAEDWNDRLLNAPNHRDNWDLVQIAELADDEQLRSWIVGETK